MRSMKRLNEEIARWAFEIHFKTNHVWHIAFTNPTAGPWKTVKALSLATGEEGEVYRFPLEEDRPDIILYSDTLRVVIIFEAKDSLEKLLEGNQAEKSAAVVVKLAGLLRSKADNKFWRGREGYRVIPGLLWGSDKGPREDAEKEELYRRYHDLVENELSVYSDWIVGVETLYVAGELKCSAFCRDFGAAESSLGGRIAGSLI